MPVVEITMFEGRTKEMKKKLIEKVTESVVDALGVSPDQVWVVIREFPRENFGMAGVQQG